LIRLSTLEFKFYAQVMLHWLLQQNLVILPKSVTPSRTQENIDIIDFELDKNNLKLLAQQNQNLRTCWNPTHVP